MEKIIKEQNRMNTKKGKEILKKGILKQFLTRVKI